MRDVAIIAALLVGAVALLSACSGSADRQRYDPSPIAMAMAEEPSKTLISGKDVKELSFEPEPLMKGSYRMRIRLTDEAADAFALITESNVGKKLCLFLDGEEFMSAVIVEKISMGEFLAPTGDSAKTERVKARLRKRPGE